jgi:hypothetical protein
MKMIFTKTRSNLSTPWMDLTLGDQLRKNLVETDTYPGTGVNIKESAEKTTLTVVFTNESEEVLNRIKADFQNSSTPLYAMTQYDLTNGITVQYNDPTP